RVEPRDAAAAAAAAAGRRAARAAAATERGAGPAAPPARARPHRVGPPGPRGLRLRPRTHATLSRRVLVPGRPALDRLARDAAAARARLARRARHRDRPRGLARAGRVRPRRRLRRRVHHRERRRSRGRHAPRGIRPGTAALARKEVARWLTAAYS